MRKLSLLFLAFTLSAGAWATDVSEALAKLNATIDQVLTEFRDDLTDARLVFDNLAVDEVRATALKLHGLLHKVGPQNTVDLRIDNFDYNYGDGSVPMVAVQGQIGLDLTKYIRQEDLNALIPDAERTLTEIAKGFTTDYGDAAEVSVVVSDKKQDENGNYVSLKGHLTAVIHLDRLPQGKDRKDVPFVSVMADAEVDLKTGLKVNLYVGMNREYRTFGPDEKGLKDYVEGLLNSDPKIIDAISRFFNDINGYATDVVNYKAN
jgi:hypothetical protein